MSHCNKEITSLYNTLQRLIKSLTDCARPNTSHPHDNPSPALNCHFNQFYVSFEGEWKRGGGGRQDDYRINRATSTAPLLVWPPMTRHATPQRRLLITHNQAFSRHLHPHCLPSADSAVTTQQYEGTTLLCH